MFRQLLSICVLLLYIPAVAGVGFSTHYCGGEQGETRVFSVSKQSCCCGEPEEKAADDCCSDDIRLVKLDKDQLGSVYRMAVKPMVFDALPAVYAPVPAPARYIVSSFTADPRPPDPPPFDRSVRFCCFLI